MELEETVFIEFLTDRGFRIRHGGQSFIMSFQSSGLALSRRKEALLAQAVQNYIAGVRGVAPPSQSPPAGPLKAVPQLTEGIDEAYRFVDEQGLPFWRAGSFQVSSLERYHHIENAGARDHFEGFGLVSLSDGQTTNVLGLEGGFSTYVICLTGRAPKSERPRMHSLFGKHLIKIHDLQQFAAGIAERLGAVSYRIADVIYSDHKIIAVRSEAATDIRRILKSGGDELSEIKLRLLGATYFPLLHNTADAVTTFCKPRRHALEWERRIAFDMPRDVDTPTRVIDAPDLVSHLTVLK